MDIGVETLAGVTLVAGLVEALKRAGLPVRFAGLAAVVVGIGMVALIGLETDDPATHEAVASWLLGGAMQGLAAAGLYSQARKGVGLWRQGAE